MPVSILMCASAVTPAWAARPARTEASSVLEIVKMTCSGKSAVISSASAVGWSIKIGSVSKPPSRSARASAISVTAK